MSFLYLRKIASENIRFNGFKRFDEVGLTKQLVPRTLSSVSPLTEYHEIQNLLCMAHDSSPT